MKSIRVLCFQLMCTVLALLFAASSFAVHHPKAKVRVVHAATADNLRCEESKRLIAYSNEYLHKIALLANWELDFVCKPLPEALDMVKQGEADLLGLTSKNPERELSLAFPKFYSGVTSSVVATRLSNTELTPYNELELRGKRVGFVYNSGRSVRFLDLMDRHEIKIQPVFFSSEGEMLGALEREAVDAVTLERASVEGDKKILLEYDFTPFYFAAAKNNRKLIKELEFAIGEVELRYPAFVNKLRQKYFPTWGIGAVALSEQEKDYIAASPVIRVAYDPAWYPLEYLDPQSGQMAGVGRDILDLIAKKSGLRFEFVTGRTAQEGIGNFLDGDCQVLSGFSSSAAFMRGHAVSEPYLSIPIAFIGNKNSIFGVNMENVTVALPAYYSETPRIVKEERPNYNIVFYPTPEDCVQAVLQGEADLTAENIYVAQHNILLKNPELAIIDTTSLNFTTQYIFAKNASPLLVSIFDKSIASISPQEVENLFFKYAAITYKRSSLVQANAQALTILGLALLALFVLALFAWQLSRKNAVVRTALAHAEEANKARTDFFKNLSHELRTPINAVMGLAQTSLAHVDDSVKVRSRLEKILASTEHLLGLINNILDMSKIEAGKMHVNPSNEDSRHNFRFLEELFVARCNMSEITLHTYFDPNISHWLVLDKVKVDQILINILGNAVKYTQPGGHVYLEAHLEQRTKDRECLRFVVRDTGMGMDAEVLHKIFVPFERARSGAALAVEGAGLGMSIARKLADMMQGSFTIESTPGEGTTVTFTLWCGIGHPPLVPTPAADAECPDIRGLRVLLVEDVDLNREIAEEMLSYMGVLVETATNGEEACLRFAASQPGHYALIFMDVMMPVLDGYAATARIRASAHPDAAHIPIVALTAHAFVEDIAEAVQCGMNDHLSKPFKAEELGNMLRKYARPGGESTEATR